MARQTAARDQVRLQQTLPQAHTSLPGEASMGVIRGVTFVSAVMTVVLALLAGDYWTALAFTGLAAKGVTK